MATPATAEAVVVKRTFAAPCEKVFEAWTRPELMQRWLCRSEAAAVVRVTQQELRMGGAFRMEIAAADGKHYVLTGEYRELRPPERLAFTWKWEHEAGEPASLVIVEFHGTNAGDTEILLRHENLPEASRPGHAWGWNACFDRLTQEMGW